MIFSLGFGLATQASKSKILTNPLTGKHWVGLKHVDQNGQAAGRHRNDVLDLRKKKTRAASQV